MRNLKLVLVTFIISLTILSCGGESKKATVSADGFGKIGKSIKSKFGNDAYFTKMTISNNEAIGDIITLTVSENPESLKMGDWTQMQGKWTQNSEITIELPQNTKAKDFMYQLNDQLNLITLGKLVEKSIEHVKAEKGLKKPKLEMAMIKFPKNGDLAKTNYYISLQPEHGGTSFHYLYALDGKLLDFSY